MLGTVHFCVRILKNVQISDDPPTHPQIQTTMRRIIQSISHNPPIHLNLNIVRIFKIRTQKWTVPYKQTASGTFPDPSPF